MKKTGLLMIAVFMVAVGAQAHADSVKVDNGSVTIEGVAAQKLFNLLTEAEKMENATGKLNTTWTYRLGKGIRCDKYEELGKETQYRCDISIESDGTILKPAVG